MSFEYNNKYKNSINFFEYRSSSLRLLDRESLVGERPRSEHPWENLQSAKRTKGGADQGSSMLDLSEDQRTQEHKGLGPPFIPSAPPTQQKGLSIKYEDGRTDQS